MRRRLLDHPEEESRPHYPLDRLDVAVTAARQNDLEIAVMALQRALSAVAAVLAVAVAQVVVVSRCCSNLRREAGSAEAWDHQKGLENR